MCGWVWSAATCIKAVCRHAIETQHTLAGAGEEANLPTNPSSAPNLSILYVLHGLCVCACGIHHPASAPG